MDVAACKRPALLLFSSKEVRIDETVDATIPVEPEAAAALADARSREVVGRLVSRVLRRAGLSPLAQAIAELKAKRGRWVSAMQTLTPSLRRTTQNVGIAA